MRVVVRPTGIQLLARAQDAGVTLTRTGAGIDLDGPADARPLIAALRGRQPLLRNAFWVYTGAARLLDWRNDCRATVIARAEPCHLCGQPACLLDPFDRQPCHKTCAETVLTPAAVAGPYRAGVAA
jgi:hypothetical protein